MPDSKADTMSDDDLVAPPTRRVWLWSGIVLLLVACAVTFALTRPRPHADARLAYPRIHGAGGVLPVGPHALMPSTAADHRLYIDVDSAQPERGELNRRLHTAAKLLNLYALAGVPDDKVHLVVLFYGSGVDVALSDAAYQAKFGHPNPNAGLMRKLRRANVKMVVCGQALGHQNFVAANIRPGVSLALSALTARQELQAAGYGEVPKEPE
ncbi:DsrE family protein [Frateuria sp. STR12]|uniref:DsrE family protein n=1 Tax=Frateuria hangzhouensis TaxID=2995589 RepID=UPI002260A3E3|nr:DsrE family protein [Frateuria sp. STR12]MCX7513164.1 DsrE family protein [Frateuria sp. STR12]